MQTSYWSKIQKKKAPRDRVHIGALSRTLFCIHLSQWDTLVDHTCLFITYPMFCSSISVYDSPDLDGKQVHLLPSPSVLYPSMSVTEALLSVKGTSDWHPDAVCLLIYSMNVACVCLVQLSYTVACGEWQRKSDLFWGCINRMTCVLTQFGISLGKK